jgi:DNA-binding CsgD family transcriptional regulator
MMKPVGSDQPQPCPQLDPEVFDLLHQIILLVEQNPSASAAAHGDDAELGSESLIQEEVMLNWSYAGMQYTLTRTLPTAQRHGALSPREQQIVQLVARGCSDKEMAEYLGISHWTIGTHLRRIFAKLGVNSRAEMVANILTHH